MDWLVFGCVANGTPTRQPNPAGSMLEVGIQTERRNHSRCLFRIGAVAQAESAAKTVLPLLEGYQDM